VNGIDVAQHLFQAFIITFSERSKEEYAYRSGQSPDWLKMKNADAPAVKRETEEDWGKERCDNDAH
jgi:hypothetical protein